LRSPSQPVLTSTSPRPTSALLPYTTLFRSACFPAGGERLGGGTRAAAETGGPAAGCRRHAGGTDAGTGAAAPAAGAIRAGKSDPGIAGAGCSDRRRVGHGGRRPPHAGAFAPGQADAVCLTVRRAAAEI